MGAAASRLFSPASKVIKFIHSDEKHNTYAYVGWHGVGMSMAAKAVAKAAEEYRDLFEVVVLVIAGEKYSSNMGKLQRRIAMQLGLIDDEKRRNDDDYDDQKRIARMISRSLAGRNFLLIIDNLMEAHDLGMMGVPTISQWSSSKIIITTPYFRVIRAMDIRETWLLLTTLESESKAPKDFGRIRDIDLGGVDDLLAHFDDEAGDVAKTLDISTGRDQVFNFFIYLCLFQKSNAIMGVDTKALMKYYVGEGFFINATSTSSSQLDGNGVDDLEGAFWHGEAILREMVARYMVNEISSSDADGDGKEISMNSHLWKILNDQEEGRHYLKEKLHIQLEAYAAGNYMLEEEARWVSLSHNKIQTSTLPLIPSLSRPRLWCAQQLTTLLLNDNLEFKQIPDTLFYQIPNLKVLDLSRTSISSLPHSFSTLIHLRLLRLQQCTNLSILPPSLKHLTQLIILDLHGTPLSLYNSIPSEALEQKHYLRLFDLSHTNIANSLLPSLLSSLCKLNLERLLLAGCNTLEGLPLLISMPSSRHHQLIRRLSELDISGCCGDFKDVENLSFQDLPKLRALNLSHTPISRLSIIKCTSLEILRLQGLTNLKSLHCSSIKIKEFPHEISKLTRLEQLHLSDVMCLRKVDWEKVHWLPEKLEWNECGCCSLFGRPATAANNLLLHLQEELSGGENTVGGGAFISVSNGKIFKGLSFSSQLWGNAFSKFHFYLRPCLKEFDVKKQKKTRGVMRVNMDKKKRKAVVAYAGIYSKMNNLHLPDHALLMRRSDFIRYLEIEGTVSNLFHGSGIHRRSLMETVVRKAKVLRLRENEGSIKSLSDLKMEEMKHLEECRVERCHNMEYLFSQSFDDEIQGPSERLWVSELTSLKTVYDGRENFLSLKNLHIHCCPKLEILFSWDPFLPQLETLYIRFCARLKSIFGGHGIVDGDRLFPRLNVLHLWELPKLKHICKGSLLSLEHLRVRACPCLQQLPGLDPKKVKIKI